MSEVREEVRKQYAQAALSVGERNNRAEDPYGGCCGPAAGTCCGDPAASLDPTLLWVGRKAAGSVRRCYGMEVSRS